MANGAARLFAGVFVCLAAAGCLDRSRVNDRCEWQAPTSISPPDLIGDVQLAEELGIRHGDAYRGEEGLAEVRRRREDCTNALLADIARRHGLTMDEVARARGRRRLGPELAAVFLPMAIVFALTAGWAAGRIFRRFPPAIEPRPAVVLTVVTSLVIGSVGFMMGDMWSWQVDAWRLGNDHLSYRALYRPWTQHPVAVVVSTVVLCWVVAVGRSRVYGSYR
jgi:hypothetical protein